MSHRGLIYIVAENSIASSRVFIWASSSHSRTCSERGRGYNRDLLSFPFFPLFPASRRSVENRARGVPARDAGSNQGMGPPGPKPRTPLLQGPQQISYFEKFFQNKNVRTCLQHFEDGYQKF